MTEASRTKGHSGEQFLQYLGQRLDNAVYRSGLAVSRRAARQLVTHGLFCLMVAVTIFHYRVKVGDEMLSVQQVRRVNTSITLMKSVLAVKNQLFHG
jgi:small subunit ribosomal protein S4